MAFHQNRGVLQGCCFSPLLFNMLLSTYTQFINSERFAQLGITASQHLLKPKHWCLFADDVAITTREEYSGATMTLRLDKGKYLVCPK